MSKQKRKILPFSTQWSGTCGEAGGACGQRSAVFRSGATRARRPTAATAVRRPQGVDVCTETFRFDRSDNLTKPLHKSGPKNPVPSGSEAVSAGSALKTAIDVSTDVGVAGPAESPPTVGPNRQLAHQCSEGSAPTRQSFREHPPVQPGPPTRHRVLARHRRILKASSSVMNRYPRLLSNAVTPPA